MGSFENYRDDTLEAINGLGVSEEQAAALFTRYCSGPRVPRLEGLQMPNYGTPVEDSAPQQKKALPQLDMAVGKIFWQIVS